MKLLTKQGVVFDRPDAKEEEKTEKNCEQFGDHLLESCFVKCLHNYLNFDKRKSEPLEGKKSFGPLRDKGDRAMG